MIRLVLLIWAAAWSLMFAASLPKLAVSKNGRFLVRTDGKPFVWIGDTMWHAYELTREEMDDYIAKRRAQGFTVVQCSLGFPAEKNRSRQNAYGLQAFGGDGNRDITTPNEEYWKLIDDWFAKLDAAGLYAAPVAFWGDPKTLTQYSAQQLEQFFRWLGHRYRGRDNIVWLTLGEGTDWDVEREKVLAAVRGLREGDTGRKLVSIHTIWGNSTVTRGYAEAVDFHTWQTSQWCSPDVLPVKAQSYRRVADPALAGSMTAWEVIASDYAHKPVKPVLDAEAWYEGDKPLGDCKAVFSNGGARPWNIRRRAYFTVFAGAFGHTYGADPVWLKTKTWRAGLDLPGAAQMGHLGRLLTSRSILDRIPDQSLIVEGQSRSYDSHVQATRALDGSWAMVYIAGGQTVALDLSRLKRRSVQVSWFDPRTGETTPAESVERTAKQKFDPPGEPGVGNDWVLVLGSK